MAKAKKRPFRVARIDLAKAVARRPRGLFRPDKVHRDETLYRRTKAKVQLKKSLEEEP